jgi:hypothetical protein
MVSLETPVSRAMVEFFRFKKIDPESLGITFVKKGTLSCLPGTPQEKSFCSRRWED